MIILQRINTVLFDLDGTLVNSNELIIDSFKETLRKYTPSITYTRDQLINLIGPPLSETFLNIMNNNDIIAEMIDYYRNFYQKNEFDYIYLYDNVLETLRELKKMNLNLGIVTTKFAESALPSIKHFGLDNYITNYAFLDSTPAHKPSPIPLFYVLKQFRNVEKTIMIGDNPSDILAGKNANIYTCGLEWSLAPEKLKVLKPDYWLYDYLELINIINMEE